MARKHRVRRIYRRAYGYSKRHPKMTIPIAVVGGLAAGLVGPIDLVAKGYPVDALSQLTKNYTGIDWANGQFHYEWLKTGMLPLLMGVAVHKLAGYAGVNRALSKIPFLRV